MGSPPEEAFDRVTALVRRTLGVPVALMSLVTADRQVFKSADGLPEPWAMRRETPLSHSLCQYVVRADAPLVVEDTRRDARLRGNGAVSEIGVVAYLGVPTHGPGGHVLGSLCATSGEPRVWSPADLETLSDLAAVVETEIALRAHVGERDRALQALRESEEPFRLLASTASDAIVTLDASGRVVYANPSVEAVFGYTPQNVIGQHIAMLMPAGLRPSHAAGMGQYVRTGERKTSWDCVETTALRADGTEFPVSISFGEYTRGGTRFFTGILRDTTAQKAAEAELVGAREEAEAAARLKSALLANMSHEIRTPLTAVLGYAEILADGVGDEQRSLVAAIEAGGRRLLATLNSVLDLSRIESGEFDLAPVRVDLLAEAEAACETSAGRGHAKGLSMRVVGEPVWARADRPAVRLVLDTLIGNAVKFTSRGAVTVRVGAGSGRAWLRVEDTGAGIAEAFLPDLFEAFKQESEGHQRAYEGTGIGLTIVRRLVDLMDGEVAVESQKGVGSAFTVFLPLAAEAPVEAPRLGARAA